MKNTRFFTKALVATVSVASLLFLTVGCSVKARSERHEKKADDYFAAGQYGKAEVEYLNALQLNRTNAQVIGRLGTIYYDAGRLSRAYSYLNKANELNPNDLEVRFKLGNIELSNGKIKEARTNALFILDHAPAHAEAPVLLAESAFTDNDRVAVRQRFEKLPAQVRESAPIQLALATLYLREKNIPAAETSVKRAVTLDPKSASAHEAMGNLYAIKRDLKNASTEFKIAAELSPTHSQRRLNYALFKLKTGEAEEGKKLLAEMTKNTPDFLPAWIRQAEIALSEKKYDDCDSFLKQVLSRDPENLEALLLHGRMFIAQGEGKKAVDDLERTSGLYQDKIPLVHYQLALAYLLNNDPPQAYKSVSQAVTLNTNYVEANLLLAKFNVDKGNGAAAIPTLERIVKQQPQLPQAELLLAQAYLVQKRPDDAIAVFHQMMTLFPKDHQVPFLLGNVLISQNQMADARKAFEKSRELAPDFIPALERLVDLDLFDKKFQSANMRVKIQVEQYPNSADPWLLFAKIHLAQKEMAEAESAFLKAIDLNPDLRAPYVLLSKMYLSSNQQQKALDKLNALVSKKTNDIEAIMEIGMIYDGMKNYPAAREAYEKLLSVNPKFSPALNNLAYIYSEKLVDLNKALKAAEQARQLSQSDPLTAASSADTLGWIYYKKGDYLRALPLLQESAVKLANEPEVQFHLGMTEYMIGTTEPARTALQNSVESKKEFSGKKEAQKRLAFLALDAKTANTSMLKQLENELHSQPEDPVVLNLVAGIYERNGAFDKAVKSYEAALNQNPDNVPAMMSLVRLYLEKLNEPKKALELVKTAHRLAPENGHISQVLGRLVYQTEDYKYALSLFQDADQRQPDQPQLIYDLALTHYSLGQVSEAEAKMQEAIKMNKTFPELGNAKRFLVMITATKSPEQVQAASAQIEETLKKDPNYVPALMASAFLQQQDAKWKEASDSYKRILAINPIFMPAARQLAFLYANHLHDDAKAYEFALKARTTFSIDPELTKTLGLSAYRKGDYAKSAQYLKEIAQGESVDGETIYYLGMAQYQLKDWVASKTSLKRALTLNLASQFSTKAKQKLAEMK